MRRNSHQQRNCLTLHLGLETLERFPVPFKFRSRFWNNVWWTLLRSRASEPCSLVIKVRALNAHAPTLTSPGARTRCSRSSIATVFVCDNGPRIQRTGDFLVILSRYPSHQYQYGCVIVLLLLAIHKDIRLIFISPL